MSPCVEIISREIPVGTHFPILTCDNVGRGVACVWRLGCEVSRGQASQELRSKDGVGCRFSKAKSCYLPSGASAKLSAPPRGYALNAKTNPRSVLESTRALKNEPRTNLNEPKTNPSSIRESWRKYFRISMCLHTRKRRQSGRPERPLSTDGQCQKLGNVSSDSYRSYHPDLLSKVIWAFRPGLAVWLSNEQSCNVF
jgi:hypothetical protein